MGDSSQIEAGALGLGCWHLGSRSAIATDGARLAELTEAMDGVRMALGFEDRFAMVIDNLMDFEVHLFRWTMIDMLRPSEGYAELFTHKRDANRFLGNLLSACRQYIDQTNRLVQPYLDDTAYTTKGSFSTEFGGHFSYRVMEALRNYVQHKDLGVHSVSVGGGWLGKPGESGRRYVVSLGIDPNEITKDEFNAKTLAEMQSLEAVPDLKQMVREYVSALATAHSRTRDALQPKMDKWEKAISAAFDDFGSAFPEEAATPRLAVFRQKADGTRDLLWEVFPEPLDRLRKLQRKNQTVLNLGPAYASSEALPPKSKS